MEQQCCKIDSENSSSRGKCGILEFIPSGETVCSWNREYSVGLYGWLSALGFRAQLVRKLIVDISRGRLEQNDRDCPRLRLQLKTHLSPWNRHHVSEHPFGQLSTMRVHRPTPTHSHTNAVAVSMPPVPVPATLSTGLVRHTQITENSTHKKTVKAKRPKKGRIANVVTISATHLNKKSRPHERVTQRRQAFDVHCKRQEIGKLPEIREDKTETQLFATSATRRKPDGIESKESKEMPMKLERF